MACHDNITENTVIGIGIITALLVLLLLEVNLTICVI